jgi:AraC-like DNA-binding protein
MRYLVHRPGPPLSRYIDHLWLYEGYTPVHTREKLLPNGVMELVIDLGEGPKRLYSQGQRRVDQDFRGAWLSGMQTDFLVIQTVPGSSMIGAHFRTLGARAFFGLPMDELANKVVSLDAILGHDAAELRERILATAEPEARLRLLECFLTARLNSSNGGNGESQRSERLVSHVIERLRHPDGAISVEQLAAECGVTRRHLLRLFNDQVGLTPKALARVLRFQGVIEAVEARGSAAVRWSELAHDCGYYDQAHFINDFRAFSGLNPRAFLRDVGEYRNFVPVRS